MSANWSKSDIVSGVLACEFVAVQDVRPGDVLIESGALFGVFRVHLDDTTGNIGLYDPWDNGGVYLPTGRVRRLPSCAVDTSWVSRPYLTSG